MLVLSRKPGESVVIGDRIKITVVKVQGNRVKLGIEAPANCRVLRAELSGWHDLAESDDSAENWTENSCRRENLTSVR